MSKNVYAIKTFKGAPHGHTTFVYNPGDPVPAELAANSLSTGEGKELTEKEAAALRAEFQGKKPKPDSDGAEGGQGAAGEGKEGGSGGKEEDDDLDNLDSGQLRAIAKKEKIKFTKTTTDAEIIAAIRKAQS